MRHAGEYYVEEWAYFFWRRGQPAIAAQLIGASDAQQERSHSPRHVNEERLVSQARMALEAELGPERMATHLAAGARLGKAEFHAEIAAALAAPVQSRQGA